MTSNNQWTKSQAMDPHSLPRETDIYRDPKVAVGRNTSPGLAAIGALPKQSR